MNNNFKNFFDDPSKILKDKKFAPTMSAKIESLMVLVGKFPNWFSSQPHRLMVATITYEINRELKESMDTGKKPDVHIFAGAFMMLINDMLNITCDQACDEEREMFDYGDEENEEEVDE